MTIARLLLRSAQIWGDRPALIDAASGRSLSFSDLADLSFHFGQTLRQRGLAIGERVAILADASAAYLVADYGSMSAGLVRVPLDPSLSADELANQIRDAQARILVFDAQRAGLAAKLVEATGTGIEPLAIDTGVFDRPRADPLMTPPDDDDLSLSSLASLNYTGGTSGEPKAVMLSHGNLRAVVQNIVMARGMGFGLGSAMGPGDVMVNMRPLWPIAAVIVLAHVAAGGTVVLGGRFEPARMVSLLDEYRAAATSMVPTHLVRLLRDCPASALRSLTALRSIDMGAASVPAATFEQALDAFGSKIGVLYGLTEASWSCYQPPSALDVPPDIRKARMTTVGRPVFGCDIMIAGEGGPALPGQPGEILIRGAHVMEGYWKRPDLTAQVLKNDWFSTGDLGTVSQDGVVSIIGRIKEVIRTGGKSVQPSEVETALCRYPGVEEASVVGIPDAEWGELVTAFVVAAPGAAVAERALKDHCAAVLSPHKRPKLIQIVAQLPKSHYGKIQRGKVRDAAIALYRDKTSGRSTPD
jgi:acyl-CoA synthetase (AMP-forming)/AMP-acid ligase II